MFKRKTEPEEKIKSVEGLRDKNTKRKYSAELKKEAVHEYLSGKCSQEDIRRKYKIFSKVQLQRWIVKYNGYKELQPSGGQGSDIYITKGRQTTYEERVEIVCYCIEHGNDYAAAIEKYGVSYQRIYSWVRKYQGKGAEGLQDKRGKCKSESEMTKLEKLRAENRRLAVRNKRLELENLVLKNWKKSKGGGTKRRSGGRLVPLRTGDPHTGIRRLGNL